MTRLVRARGTETGEALRVDERKGMAPGRLHPRRAWYLESPRHVGGHFRVRVHFLAELGGLEGE